MISYIIVKVDTQRCPRGRRSMIGNHVYGEHRTEGSNPSLCAKK